MITGLILLAFVLGMVVASFLIPMRKINYLWYFHKHDTGERGEEFRKYIG